MGSNKLSKEGPSARQPDDFVAVGRIVRPHGVRGALVFEPASELGASLKAGDRIFVGEERRPVIVRSLQPHAQRLLLRLEGVEEYQAAEKLRLADVAIGVADAAPLPEGTYYRWQILGLEVRTEQGEVLGHVADILETGANDVYLVRSQHGAELLLPAIEPVIRHVDLDAGRLTVHLLPGLRP
jgi:16S rRNA processing protein RimM